VDCQARGLSSEAQINMSLHTRSTSQTHFALRERGLRRGMDHGLAARFVVARLLQLAAEFCNSLMALWLSLSE
jgi:hypothetical protein